MNRIKLIGFLLLLVCGATFASTVPPSLGMRIIHRAEFVREGIVYSDEWNKPYIECEIRPVGAAAGMTMGPYDIYFVVLRPDGRWYSWVMDPRPGASLQQLVPGLVPLATSLHVQGESVLSNLDLAGRQGARLFPAGTAKGVHWVACLAMQAGQSVDDLAQWRHVVMTPVVLQ